MSSLSNIQLTLVSLVFFSFIASLLINYILLKFARTLGIRSKNANEVRWDPNHKPSLGGISFYITFLFSFISFVIIFPDFSGVRWTVFGILLAVSLAFLMGLADDAFNTQPLLKLITQIVCALVLEYSGISISLFENALLNYALTIFWVVALMNSFNLLDNMDGITGSISLVLTIFFAIICVSLKQNHNYLLIFNICLAGSIFGFLFYNFHPSRMYMGDSGSQFLGLFLAAMGIEFCWNNHQVAFLNSAVLENVCLALLIFILPITDTTTVFINRISKGNSPFVGGKDHTTHHLFFKGITEKRIALLYLIITSISSFLAYNIIESHSMVLIYISYLYIAIVFFSLYLNTRIAKK